MSKHLGFSHLLNYNTHSAFSELRLPPAYDNVISSDGGVGGGMGLNGMLMWGRLCISSGVLQTAWSTIFFGFLVDFSFLVISCDFSYWVLFLGYMEK